MPPPPIDGIFNNVNEVLEYLRLPRYENVRNTRQGALTAMIPYTDNYKHGELLFEANKDTPDSFSIKNIRYTSSSGGTKSIEHYSIKKFFYDTADLVIKANIAGDSYTIIFKVRIDQSGNMGGSLTYVDLDLTSEDKINTFLKRIDFSRDRQINRDDSIKSIIRRMQTFYMVSLKTAAARELVEEGTPDGTRAPAIMDVAKDLQFKTMFHDIKRNEIIITAYFSYIPKITHIRVPLKKARELDSFPMLYNNIPVDLHYIYNESGTPRGVVRFTSKLPFILIEPSDAAIIDKSVADKFVADKSVDSEIVSKVVTDETIRKCREIIAEADKDKKRNIGISAQPPVNKHNVGISPRTMTPKHNVGISALSLNNKVNMGTSPMPIVPIVPTLDLIESANNITTHLNISRKNLNDSPDSYRPPSFKKLSAKKNSYKPPSFKPLPIKLTKMSVNNITRRNNNSFKPPSFKPLSITLKNKKYIPVNTNNNSFAPNSFKKLNRSTIKASHNKKHLNTRKTLRRGALTIHNARKIINGLSRMNISGRNNNRPNI